MEKTDLNQESIQSLSVPLPEDILKLKWCGEFEQAEKIIDRRLAGNLPGSLRERLLLEKEILKRMPGQYPYTWEGALERMRQNIREFRDGELQELWESGGADWIYVKGKVHFRENFLENVLKTRPEYAERVLSPEKAPDQKRAQLLDHTIGVMKAEGGEAWRFRLQMTLSIDPAAEREGEPVRVYLPLPVEYAQIRNVEILAVRIGGREARPDEYRIGGAGDAQRTVCIEGIHRKGQTYQVETAFENHGDYVDLYDGGNLAAAGLAAGQDGEERGKKGEEISAGSAGGRDDPLQYLGQQLPHIRFTPYLRALAEEIVGNEQNPLVSAQKIYEFVTTQVMYSYVRSYLTLENIPESAAVSLKGDCGVQALLFITLCRIAGIPARWQAGLYTAPGDVGNHDWAQFYVKPFGWRYADCSFGGSAYRQGAEERHAFYFGNLDPFRFPAAREFQAPFQPPFSHLRNDPYDNQVGEAEYGDRALLSDEYETKAVLLQAEPLKEKR